MTNRIILGIILAFLAVLTVYLCFSFIAWEFNPQHWDIVGRFAFVVLGGISGGVAFTIPFDLVKQ